MEKRTGESASSAALGFCLPSCSLIYFFFVCVCVSLACLVVPMNARNRRCVSAFLPFFGRLLLGPHAWGKAPHLRADPITRHRFLDRENGIEREQRHR